MGRKASRGHSCYPDGSPQHLLQRLGCSWRPACAQSVLREGTLFPWTVSDFSLMDAIESGIVKLPRVPVADNIAAGEMPRFRNLWHHIGKKMPKRGRTKGGGLDPLDIPIDLQTALQALYGHYAKTFELWYERGVEVPPCFIIVCNNTSTSKLVYDFVSGFERKHEDGSTTFEHGRLALFRNFDETGQPLAQPRTLLIDSTQLESGDALDKNFRDAARDEIEQFRREIIARTGDRRQAENLSDQNLLREVMNTVGKKDRLGGGTRCVVSVSMLTEGWDANTVTHVLGVRAFGTQLLCEQVIGRSLRRQSYHLNEDGVFNVEYADVLGIPFDFTARPVVAPPQPPPETIQVKAISPERAACEIHFPRVQGYRVELPEERVSATFDANATLVLTPDIVGPSVTRNEGIIGEGIDLSLKHLDKVREATLVFHLTKRLLETKWRDRGGDPKLHLFDQLKRITRQWLAEHLVCHGGTYPAQLLYQSLADTAEKRAAIFIGPEFGTVARPDLVAAAREAADAGFDVLVACAFNYEAHASEFKKLGKVPILKARMNADLHMADDLKNTGKGNLFVIFGEPDIDILPVEGNGAEPGQFQVKVNGVDVFDPSKGEVRSDDTDSIACWFIDTDYEEESFFVRHAYFLGAGDPYKALKTTLKAEINEDAWATLRSDLSRPFDRPTSGRIAVKVINHLGDEVMKVFRV